MGLSLRNPNLARSMRKPPRRADAFTGEAQACTGHSSKEGGHAPTAQSGNGGHPTASSAGGTASSPNCESNRPLHPNFGVATGGATRA